MGNWAHLTDRQLHAECIRQMGTQSGTLTGELLMRFGAKANSGETTTLPNRANAKLRELATEHTNPNFDLDTRNLAKEALALLDALEAEKDDARVHQYYVEKVIVNRKMANRRVPEELEALCLWLTKFSLLGV